MGASIENAIVMSAVILIISALIVLPFQMCSDTYSGFCRISEEISYHGEDDEIVSSRNVGAYSSCDVSPERLCTFLTGLSENYRIIYDTIAED